MNVILRYSLVTLLTGLAACHNSTISPDIEIYICTNEYSNSSRALLILSDVSNSQSLEFRDSGTISDQQLRNLGRTDFYPENEVPILAQLRTKGPKGKTVAVFANGSNRDVKTPILTSFFFHEEYDRAFFVGLLDRFKNEGFRVVSTYMDCV